MVIVIPAIRLNDLAHYAAEIYTTVDVRNWRHLQVLLFSTFWPDVLRNLKWNKTLSRCIIFYNWGFKK